MIAGAAALILAGGTGRRMGGLQKAFLRLDGQTLFERQLAVLRPLFSDIAVSANDPAPFAASGLPILADRLGQGPLAGIEAGLDWCAQKRLLVVACDLPFVDAAVITALAFHNHAIVIPRVGDVIQPLLGFYARSCQSFLAARLARSANRVLDLLDEPELDVYVHELRPDQATVLTNWNTPILGED